MKRFHYIFILFSILLSGCDEVTQIPEDELIVVPSKPYIYLDAGVSTRASLVNGTVLQRNFGVYGFTYDFNNKWSTYRVTAKPNVFEDVPQLVTYNNGSYRYSPIKEWQGGKYTFFAYYPNVDASSKDVEGTPYVIYAPDFRNTADHRDVMTAMFEDTSLSSSPYVYFDFYHRLSAVDVVAKNFYEYSYDDPNTENTVITEKITIDIVDLALQFENIQYQKAKIYLDRRIASERTPADPDIDPPYYQIISEANGSGIFINYNEDATLRPITAQNNSSMIFIPQENIDLKVTTTVKFKKRRPNGEYITDDGGNEVFTQTIVTPFKQPLKEGSRYYLQMTFTSSAVSISIITSDEWDDIPVDFEFE